MEQENRLLSNGAEAKDVSNKSSMENSPQDPDVKTSTKTSKFINIKSWVAFMTFIAVFLMSDQMLRYATLTTLERRFGFPSAMNGVIVSAYDVGHVVLLAVLSFVGHKVHRPRMCALGCYLSVASGFLWALPHFVFGPGDKPALTSVQENNVTERIVDFGICDMYSNESFISTGFSCDAEHNTVNATLTSQEGPSTEAIISFVMLILSQCLLGAGFAPFLTVAVTYLDDNTDPATSAIGVSIYLSVSCSGPVMGYLLGALTTSTYVDLGPTPLKPNDPEWVGAWWLGSLLLAILTFLVSFPLLFFPRNFETSQDSGSSEKDKVSDTATEARRRISTADGSAAERMRPMLQRQVSELDVTAVKDAPQKSRRLATNVVFICVTLTMCCMQYMMAGLMPFIPKYLENQFQIDAFVANIITSVITAFAAGAGTFVGGYIAAEKELKPLGAARLIIIGLVLGIVCFVGAMFLGCPQPKVGGNIGVDAVIDPIVSCNRNCSCTGSDFLPVCGSDGVNYYSACHAGCQTILSAEGDTVSFVNCTCIPGATDEVMGTAVSSPCYDRCMILIPYAIIVFICMFCVCMGRSPLMALLVRCVEPTQKSLAIGITNILTSILSSIPGPMIYGIMIDSTCEITMPGCGEQGTCILYKNKEFRLYLHGVTNTFLVLGSIIMFVAHQKLRKMDFSFMESSTSQVKAPLKDSNAEELQSLQNGNKV